MVEDFTHVLPEDKAAPIAKTPFQDQVFDLKTANEREKHLRRLRQELQAIERDSREKFKALLNRQNNTCNL